LEKPARELLHEHFTLYLVAKSWADSLHDETSTLNPIDNVALCTFKNSEVTSILPNLVEGTDFVLVSPDLWNSLRNTYGGGPELQISVVDNQPDLSPVHLDVLRVESPSDYDLLPRGLLISLQISGGRLKGLLEEVFMTTLNDCELLLADQLVGLNTATRPLSLSLPLLSQGVCRGTTVIVKSIPAAFDQASMDLVYDDERLTTRTSSTEFGQSYDEFKEDYPEVSDLRAIRHDTEEVVSKVKSAMLKKKLRLGLKSLSSIRRSVESLVSEWWVLKKQPETPSN
jgi:hypothetical protein